MRKRLLPALLALVLALVLGACSGGKIISETSDLHAYSLSCERLTDTRQAAVSVGESASATLSASISRGRGSLSVRISGSDGSEVYAGNDIASSTSFTLMLEGPETYTVSLTCDGFTGSVDLTWETVGAVGAAPEPSADPAPADGMTITNNAPDAAPEAEPDASSDAAQDAPADAGTPDWNGTFENTATGVTISLAWADNHTVEFQLSGLGSVVTATARIDSLDRSRADYSYGDEMTLTFRLDEDGLAVAQDGTCTLIPDDISGTYTQTAD